MPPLSALRAFEAAARLGSLSGAARELNVTHAAVAQQVRRLEAWFGFRLMERAGRGVAPTPEGAQLAEGLGEGFAAIFSTVQRLTADAEGQGLRITATPSFAQGWLMPRIGAFRAAEPDLELMINPTTEVIDIIADNYDVAFRYGRGQWHGVEARRVLASEVVVVAERRLLERHPVAEPADLADVPWVQELGTEEVASWLAANCVERGQNTSILTLPGHLAIPAVREGQGFALIARAWVEKDIEAGRVIPLFLKEQDPLLGYYMVHRPPPHRTALKRFLAWARREICCP